MEPVDVAAMADHVESAARRVCTLLRKAGDLDRPALGDWTARDVGAHIVWGVELYTGMLGGQSRRADSVEGISDLNADGVAEVQESTGEELADRLETALVAYDVAARRLTADDVLPWHAGLELPSWALLSLHLGEHLIHGHDIASAVGRPWSISDDEASAVFRGLRPVLPHYLDEKAARGFTGRFDIRLRGHPEARTLLAIADGRLEVGDPDGKRVHCVISADPVTFLLVNYGRMGPGIPALTGRIRAWGLKPWLGFRLPTLFRSP